MAIIIEVIITDCYCHEKGIELQTDSLESDPRDRTHHSYAPLHKIYIDLPNS